MLGYETLTKPRLYTVGDRSTSAKPEIAVLGIDDFGRHGSRYTRHRRDEAVKVQDILTRKKILQFSCLTWRDIKTVKQIGIVESKGRVAIMREHFALTLGEENAHPHVARLRLRFSKVQNKALDSTEMCRPQNMQDLHEVRFRL